MVFVDLEKAYDQVPRELIWWCLRKKGVPEGYVTIIQDMYNDCETLVSTRTGDTEYFHVGVGLHQGSALSPLLFIQTLDVLQADIGKMSSSSLLEGKLEDSHGSPRTIWMGNITEWSGLWRQQRTHRTETTCGNSLHPTQQLMEPDDDDSDNK